jgi:dipeptidyl-peptidase-4
MKLLVLSAAALALCSSLRADPLMAKAPFVPTSQYVQREMLGWKLLINEELLAARGEVGGKALALLESKLQEICEVVPAGALGALKRVPIWLGVDDYAVPNACYHPSADWLRTHGWNPDKAGAVEIGNAAIFLEWSSTQPMIVLHELAHAYHHRVLTHQHAGIIEAFRRAQKSGRYDAVNYTHGERKRAYAMNNEQEFFAETSEAYFGRNDFFPFTRTDLAQHDAETLKLLQHVWEQDAGTLISRP